MLLLCTFTRPAGRPGRKGGIGLRRVMAAQGRSAPETGDGASLPRVSAAWRWRWLQRSAFWRPGRDHAEIATFTFSHQLRRRMPRRGPLRPSSRPPTAPAAISATLTTLITLVGPTSLTSAMSLTHVSPPSSSRITLFLFILDRPQQKGFCLGYILERQCR